MKTKRQRIIISLILAAILVVGGVGAYFIFKDRIKYNHSAAAIVKSRVESASFLPNLKYLAFNQSTTEPVDSAALEAEYDDKLTLCYQDYELWINNLSKFAGTTAIDDQTIYKIRDEFYTCIDLAPSFNKWYKFPSTAKEYTNNYYKFDYDYSTEQVVLSRLSSAHSARIYKSANNQILDSSQTELAQHQLVELTLTHDADGREVVSCMVLDFLKVKDNFHPIQLQLLKNVENICTTKVQLLFQKEVSMDGVQFALDLDTAPSGGVSRKITQLDYTDLHNVNILEVEQNFETDYYSNINTTNLAYYTQQIEESLYYSTAWDYFDEENSLDEIPLNYFFKAQENNSSSMARGLMASQYSAKQTSTSCSACSDCAASPNANTIEACNHNKNAAHITRCERQLLCSGVEIKSRYAQLLTWHMGHLVNSLIESLDAPNSLVEDYTSKLCSELNSNYKFEKNIDAITLDLSKWLIAEYDIKSIFNDITTSSVNLKNSALNEKNIPTKVELQNFDQSIVVQKSLLKIRATASVKSSKILDKGAEYSLCFIYYDATCNAMYIPLSNYVKYKGGTLDLTLSGTVNLNDLALSKKDAHLNANISLSVGFALVKKSPIKPIICSNIISAYFEDTDFSSIESSSNGYITTFHPMIIDNKLYISLNFVDCQKAGYDVKYMLNNTIYLPFTSTAYDIWSLISVSDNDSVQSMKLTHSGLEYPELNYPIAIGAHELKLTDRTGNTITHTFFVELPQN